MRLPIFALCLLSAACDRRHPSGEAQAAPSSSVITLAVAVGGCEDLAVCERECDAGSSDRCRRLGATYALGQGVEKDETRATELYEHACAMQDPSACVFAGQMHEFARGVPKSDAEAAHFYELACGRGWPPGCYNLAIMYERGTGVPEDHALAAELYQRACAGGAKSACEKAKALREPSLPFFDGGLP